MQIIKMKKVLNNNKNISKWIISLKCPKCLVGERIHSLLRLTSVYYVFHVGGDAPHAVKTHYPITSLSQQPSPGRWSIFQVGRCLCQHQVCGTVARYQEMIFLSSNLLFVKHRMQVIYKLRWSRVSSRTRWSHHLLARSETLLWLSFPTSHGLSSVPYFLLMSTWLHPLFFLLYYWILVCTHHIFFTYLSVYGHVWWFYNLAIMNDLTDFVDIDWSCKIPSLREWGPCVKIPIYTMWGKKSLK